LGQLVEVRLLFRESMMNIWDTLVRFFQGGGNFMFPIAVVLVVGLSIAIERYIYLVRVSTRNRQLWNEIVPMLSQGNFRQVVQITSKNESAIAQILNYGLARIQAARRRDDIEKAMEESLMEVVPRLEKRTHYLATFANLATLLGLLGTVMGLINAFRAVATVNPAEKANLLSASISVAMNCTAFGLMTAVPLLFIHAFLQTKTTELVDSLEMASVKFLNAVTERRPEAPAPAAA
jgi:biopolymer transport protein ExbB/TolQ